MAEPRNDKTETPMRQLDRLVAHARAVLFWEALWRALVPPLIVAGLFIALGFTGLWLELGPLWREAGVGLFGIAFVASLVPLFGLRNPARKAALARIDRSSDFTHGPASGLDDSLANANADPATQALWNLHRKRLAARVSQLRVGAPSPRVADLDRYAVRAAVLVLLVASAFMAGPEKYARIAAAFDWHGAAPVAASYRIDAWLDPPAYTGKPPVLLQLGRPDQATKVEAPINSMLIVRAAGGDVDIETQGGLVAAPKEANAPQAPGESEHRLALRGDSELTLKHAGATVGVFNIAVIPDRPPQIELTDAPRFNLRGSLTLSYKIDDDYGAISAEAVFADPQVDGAHGMVRSLVAAPHFSLVLPAGGIGEAETTGDVSDHPWAGARVKMTLIARDEGGNVGRSDPIEITLPQRPFVKPIAKALVEQRRNLVLYPEERDKVQTALDALMIAPNMFGVSDSIFLGLSFASASLQEAQSDKELVGVADFLWAMALQIENGGLSDAERDLRAAEQHLRDALQRNASPDEIRKLTDNLRAALDKFLREFAARQAQQQGQEAQRSPNGPQSVTRQDLQSMLDRMEQMANAGDREDAQKMLEQLQNTLENLQMANQQNQDPAMRAMNQAMRDLDRLTHDQQKLRDETQRLARSQDQDQPDQNGANQPMTAQQLHDLQQDLQKRLQDLQKQLQKLGQNHSGLKDAQKAMEDAAKSLSAGRQQGQDQQGQQGQGQQQQGQEGQGQQGGEGQGGDQQGQQQGQGQSPGDSAVAAQGRALEGLRKGAEQLAQSMQQGQGQGQQAGNQQGQGQAEGAGDEDPLGRPMADDPALNPNSRLNMEGLPAAERAQRVLEELRRRLSDPWRSQEELDYLERLLKPY
ncbi:MAG: TIGR02302 family protein [Pseudomonadota bacterium]